MFFFSFNTNVVMSCGPLFTPPPSLCMYHGTLKYTQRFIDEYVPWEHSLNLNNKGVYEGI